LEALAGLRPAQAGSAVFRDSYSVPQWESVVANDGLRLPIGPCAFVEQHPYIFEGTLRENLTFGNSTRPSDAILWEALEHAGLYRFATQYGGLDHFLHDRGRNLSEGERYRIAMCRALLLRRPFLLLDEPFAALDEVSISLIARTLNRHKIDAGIVMVTHYVPNGLELNGGLNFGKFHRKDENGVANESQLERSAVWTPIIDERALASSTTTTN
jgi:ABC-type transport system involved in cytochrome bd biosynthesis fused ATPase/permease subunit